MFYLDIQIKRYDNHKNETGGICMKMSLGCILAVRYKARIAVRNKVSIDSN
jgi:hypothetical protein